MFSGIIEATGVVKSLREDLGVLRVEIEKPIEFNDLRSGDSICVDGVCLTVESFSDGLMRYAIGPETLRVTGWTLGNLQNRRVNLERSLKLGDRIHGHIVTGHVDTVGEIARSETAGEALLLTVHFPAEFGKFIWRKGSITVNGVSLTINSATASEFELCLIPETLKRTNLAHLRQGDRVNLEMDSYARGLVHLAERQREAWA